MHYLAGSFVLLACSGTDDSLGNSSESDANAVIASASSAMTEATIVATGAGRAAGPVTFAASLSVAASATGCDNRGGPDISIAGDMVVSGFGAKVVATNNIRRTHVATDETSAFVTLHNGQDVIKVSKGGKYGVSGNPEMYLEVYDHADHLIGSRMYLGRCNRPLPASKMDFTALGDIDYGISTGQCSGAGGPQVNLTGAVTLHGIKAKLILQKKNGTRSVGIPVEFAISLLEPGKKMMFDKRPPFGGAGGNPWFYGTLTNHAGKPVSGEILFGRCNSMEH
jgi:hypothetical protein